MKLDFVKMHGIGNDFVLIDNMSRRLQLGGEQIRLLADRRRGIGCDQLLVLEPPDGADAVARARIFNQDGNEVGQCGNGLRCLAVHMRDLGMANGAGIAIEAGDGMVRARFASDGEVSVDMGIPRFEPRDIPFVAEARAPSYVLEVASQRLEIGAVSVGNPHAVLRVDDCDTAPVETLGPAVQALAQFPQGVNVGFLQIVDTGRARLRVFERGVGETQACGSGTCAAVAVGRTRGWLGPGVSVALPGGELRVDWEGEGRAIWLAGPTHRSFEGKFEL